MDLWNVSPRWDTKNYSCVLYFQSTNTGSFLNEEVDFTNVRTGS